MLLGSVSQDGKAASSSNIATAVAPFSMRACSCFLAVVSTFSLVLLLLPSMHRQMAHPSIHCSYIQRKLVDGQAYHDPKRQDQTRPSATAILVFGLNLTRPPCRCPPSIHTKQTVELAALVAWTPSDNYRRAPCPQHSSIIVWNPIYRQRFLNRRFLHQVPTLAPY